MKHVIDIVIIVVSVLGACFPACLINAIRNENEDKAEKSKIAACIIMGIIIFTIMALIRS